jgi:hypothetical protein
MFATLALGALLGLGAHPGPCAKPLPRGPAVPATLVLSTDCGWFSLETDGQVRRLPKNWYATHQEPWHPPYGLTYAPRSGRYVVSRDGQIIWRSARAYYNEAGGGAFGPHAFAFESWGRRGIMLTDLRGPERLVLRGRNRFTLGFTAGGELLVSGPQSIIVLSRAGKVVRWLRFRRSTSFVFDPTTQTVYFVTPKGMLTAARGSDVRPIGIAPGRGWIGLAGHRFVTFTAPGRLAIVRGGDGSLVASAGWRDADRELDAGVEVSQDGKLFAFSTSGPGARSQAVVYLLRAGQRRARVLFRHRTGQPGCGDATSLDWRGSSLLYRFADATVDETAVLRADGPVTRLTPILRALPRNVPTEPGNVYWEADFST